MISYSMSSLLRGHANILCIVPNLTDDPRRESDCIISYYGGAADVRAEAHLAHLAGLADLDEGVLGTSDLANRAVALLREEAHLSAGQLHGDPLVVAGQDDAGGARSADDRAAPAGVHLDVVNHRADRHVVQRHGVADEDRRVGRGDDLLAHVEAHGLGFRGVRQGLALHHYHYYNYHHYFHLFYRYCYCYHHYYHYHYY